MYVWNSNLLHGIAEMFKLQHDTAVRASYLMLRINVMSHESEKACSCQESNPGHLWLEPPVLCHWAKTARQPPPTPTILYMYYTVVPDVIYYHLCSTCRELWGMVVVQLLCIAQWQSISGSSQGFLGWTPGSCLPFHFPLFSPHNIIHLWYSGLVLPFYIFTSIVMIRSTQYHTKKPEALRQESFA